MAGVKACKQCKTLFEGAKCPACGSHEFSDAHKGKVIITNAEQSEIAKNLKYKQNGTYAVKL